ncbi:hypothetical protein K505DRAFT_367622 [Melanomma pulvis-pyrius CBS 109.77]|uniref:Uncharacterized protein n=1 Tax=Melanomma pulvis-pyrius CBS 109.77 TaxID=1314802 RepID=A0A6A6WT89_9PLEO|nr:hypothetical protein K505DRAFT_367622 [Melanomma pulvis-pyrius CBS 109.77]
MVELHSSLALRTNLPQMESHSGLGCSNISKQSSLFTLVQSTLTALSHEVDKDHIGIDPAEKWLLSGRLDEAAQRIADAIKPKVASFLLSGKDFTVANILNTGDGYNDRHQGVYANLVTNENDALYASIYIGSAAGPYKQPLKDRRRDRGLHQRILSHNQQSVRQRSLKKHERLLQNPGIHSNWLVIVSFQQNVPKALVHLAHAVVTVMFRASENPHYLACRLDRLPICHQFWGLNELSSLGHHGLADYNRIRHGQSIEEATLVHERNVTAGQRHAHSGRQDHYNRLIGGSPIRVNVLVINGVVQRFFITPLTKADGCHIDVTIPRGVGLTYGLQVSRTVTVQFDLQLGRDHSQPYAVKAPSCSFSRQLGILISGEYTYGPQMGKKFEHWIQSNRHEAISKPEKLVRKIYAGVETEGSLRTGTNPKGQQPTKLDGWLEDGTTSELERANI